MKVLITFLLLSGVITPAICQGIYKGGVGGGSAKAALPVMTKGSKLIFNPNPIKVNEMGILIKDSINGPVYIFDAQGKLIECIDEKNTKIRFSNSGLYLLTNGKLSIKVLAF